MGQRRVESRATLARRSVSFNGIQVRDSCRSLDQPCRSLQALSPWSVWSGSFSSLGSSVSRADFARIFFDFTGFSKDSALREVFRR
jgi:hypothetical protein